MSNGSAREPGRPGRPGRLGLPARARGERDRAGLHPGLAPALGRRTRAPCWMRAVWPWASPKARWATARWGTSTSAPAGWCPRISSGSPRASRAASSTSSRRWSSCAPRSARAAGRSTWSACSGPGGVHALDRHLLACVELGVRHRVPAIAIHGFLDGRDSSPTLGAEVVRTLLLDMRRIAGARVDIASLTGRYFGMDRDRRWDRTRLAYDAMVHGVGTAGGAPGAGGAGRLSARRDRRVHPAAGAPSRRRPGGHDARRRRGAVLQLPQRPDAADRERPRARGLRRVRPGRPAVALAASP